MGFFGKALMGGVKGIGKLTLGGGGRRMVTGAAIGSIYGGATSEANTPTGIFRDMIGGAAIGIGAGALTARSLWMKSRPASLRGLFNSPVAKGVKGAARLGMGAGKIGLRAGFGAIKFTARHPYAALGIAGAGYGMYALGNSGPGQSGMNEKEMAAIARMHGGPSTGFDIGMGTSRRQNSRQMFMESTFGLTQGLHASRHR